MAAFCRPRQEKALAWDLCRREVSYFLPMVMRVTSSGGRRRRNLYPLFPSYLFLAAGEREQLVALKTDRLVKLIKISECQQAQFRQEMTNLEIAVRECPGSVELYPRLVSGARARIKSGAMKDLEGIVVEADNKRKIWLGVSVLGVGATVEIHADLVEIL